MTDNSAYTAANQGATKLIGARVRCAQRSSNE
jgi:hypothetical protein